MPIYEQTFRPWKGKVRSWFRWSAIVEQELRILFGIRSFWILLALAGLFVMFRSMQIFAYSLLMTDPSNPMVAMLQNVQAVEVGPGTFYGFIGGQAALVLITTILAGSGMLCNDFRNNLMEIYFSKPLRWFDYVTGKVATLMVIGFLLTAVPGVFLLVLYNLLVPGWKTVTDTYWIFFAICGFSLLIVTPCSLIVLLISGMTPSQRLASIVAYLVVVGHTWFFSVLAELLRRDSLHFFSLPVSLTRLGEILFRQRAMVSEIPGFWPLVYCIVVSMISLFLICRKVKRAEMDK